MLHKKANMSLLLVQHSMAKFYITTPIYYVNGLPHIGAAYTSIAADVLARYHRARGDDVHFLMGTDENAQKNVEAALKSIPSPQSSPEGVEDGPSERRPRGGKGEGETQEIVQKYVDAMAAKWQETWDELGLTNDDFIRTTEPRHIKYVEKFWRKVEAKGDIYKSVYEGLYCTGCEAYKTESELIDGKCPDHMRVPKKLSEENYFFRLSRYRDALLKHIDEHPEFIQPEARRNEIVAYIRDHAVDFSISRKNLEWGIAVPGDPAQTIYVWFDALLNYISAVTPSPGFQPSSPSGRGEGEGWWPADLHLVGKDIIKFHCAYWPAMLMSAGLPLPRTVFAHGFFTVDGQKMSKTLGNVIDPVALARKYGNDVLRYYLLRDFAFGEDGDFSEVRLRARYNGELANGLGNLVARVLTMVEKYADGVIHNPTQPPLILRGGDRLVPPLKVRGGEGELWSQYESYIAHYQLDRALDTVWQYMSELDRYIDETQPWQLAKSGKERLFAVLYTLAEGLRHIAWMLIPFMPETARNIFDQLGLGTAEVKKSFKDAQKWGGLKSGVKIERGDSLFPRLA